MLQIKQFPLIKCLVPVHFTQTALWYNWGRSCAVVVQPLRNFLWFLYCEPTVATSQLTWQGCSSQDTRSEVNNPILNPLLHTCRRFKASPCLQSTTLQATSEFSQQELSPHPATENGSLRYPEKITPLRQQHTAANAPLPGDTPKMHHFKHPIRRCKSPRWTAIRWINKSTPQNFRTFLYMYYLGAQDRYG